MALVQCIVSGRAIRAVLAQTTKPDYPGQMVRGAEVLKPGLRPILLCGYLTVQNTGRLPGTGNFLSLVSLGFPIREHR